MRALFSHLQHRTDIGTTRGQWLADKVFKIGRILILMSKEPVALDLPRDCLAIAVPRVSQAETVIRTSDGAPGLADHQLESWGLGTCCLAGFPWSLVS